MVATKVLEAFVVRRGGSSPLTRIETRALVS